MAISIKSLRKKTTRIDETQTRTGTQHKFGPYHNFRPFFSLPSSGQFVEHFLVQFGVRLFAKGQENVSADVLVNDLNFGGVAFETVGISVDVKR